MCCSRQLAQSLEAAQQQTRPPPPLQAPLLPRPLHPRLPRWLGWQRVGCRADQPAGRLPLSKWRRLSCREWRQRPAQPKTTKSEQCMPSDSLDKKMLLSAMLLSSSGLPQCAASNFLACPKPFAQVGPADNRDLPVRAVQHHILTHFD